MGFINAQNTFYLTLNLEGSISNPCVYGMVANLTSKLLSVPHGIRQESMPQNTKSISMDHSEPFCSGGIMDKSTFYSERIQKLC